MGSNIREQEIKRLIWYAKGMGVTVKIKPYVPRTGAAATWSLDGLSIEIFVKKGWSKIYILMSIIHELGHHKDFIQKGRRFSFLSDKALGESKPNKAMRKVILDSELAGARYWADIYRDTGCKFGMKHVLKHKEKDMWVYRHFYETGDFPSQKLTRKKDKELRKKYRC